MIEPAAYGAAVMFGPNTWNFRSVVELLLARQAALVVQDAGELTSRLQDLLEHPEKAQRLGATAQAAVFSQQGATQRTVQRLASDL